MPIKHNEIQTRLQECDAKLNKLLAGYVNDAKIRDAVTKVSNHYKDAYLNTTSNHVAERVAKKYEFFIAKLEGVNNGKGAEKASKEFKQNYPLSKKLYNLFHHLAKVVQSIVWAATTATLLGAIQAVAIPLILTQPAVGIIVGIALAGLAVATAIKALSGLKDFININKICHTEKAVLSFFKKTTEEQRKPAPSKAELPPKKQPSGATKDDAKSATAANDSLVSKTDKLPRVPGLGSN